MSCVPTMSLTFGSSARTWGAARAAAPGHGHQTAAANGHFEVPCCVSEPARQVRPAGRARNSANCCPVRPRGRGTATGRSRVTRPRDSTITRSASRMASSTSCVTSTTAGRCRCQSCATSSCIRIRVSASRLAERFIQQQTGSVRAPSPVPGPHAGLHHRTESSAKRRHDWRGPTSVNARHRALTGHRTALPEDDILPHPLGRNEPWFLEYDGAPTGDADGAAIGLVQSRQQTQQCRLAGARRAENRNEFRRPDRQFETVENGALTKGPGEPDAVPRHDQARNKLCPPWQRHMLQNAHQQVDGDS